MLLRFLNLSPPCAASAAAASSVGVLFAVIAGVAGADFATAGAPFDLPGSALLANAVEHRVRKTTRETAAGAYRFMLGPSDYRNERGDDLIDRHLKDERRAANVNCLPLSFFCNLYAPNRGRFLETESK